MYGQEGMSKNVEIDEQVCLYVLYFFKVVWREVDVVCVC